MWSLSMTGNCLFSNFISNSRFLAFTPQRQSVLTQKKQSEPQKSFLNLLSLTQITSSRTDSTSGVVIRNRQGTSWKNARKRVYPKQKEDVKKKQGSAHSLFRAKEKQDRRKDRAGTRENRQGKGTTGRRCIIRFKTAGAISSVFQVEGAQKQTFPEPPNTGGRGMSSLIQLKNGGDLLSHWCAVPSARTGLTSLFGMGRGGTPTLWPPE